MQMVASRYCLYTFLSRLLVEDNGVIISRKFGHT